LSSNQKLYQTKEGKERKKESMRKWRKANPRPDKQRIYLRKCLYGITDDVYNETVKQQKGVCAICKKSSEKSLQVDHCHNTGKIRGLLCGKCNRGLGMFGDNISGIRNVLNYLEQKDVE
jgi:hypothetical protein